MAEDLPDGGPPNMDALDIDSLVEEANGKAGVSAEQMNPVAPQKVEAPGEEASPAREGSDAEDLLAQAEADLGRALSDDLADGPESAVSGGAQRFEFRDLSPRPAGQKPLPMSALQDVELDLRIELGRTELLIDDVMKLSEGSVVQLDKLAGDPVDILVNGRLIARGEVLVLNDNFCVRVADILSPDV